MKTHTQTHWHVELRPDVSIEIQTEDNVPVAVACYSPKYKYNAEFIVKACNSHEALVAALQLTVDVFNQKEIDPLMAFIAIERAKQALANIDK